LRWSHREIARQYAMVSVRGCSGPSTRLCTGSTSRRARISENK
jgi:hypothetical protein